MKKLFKYMEHYKFRFAIMFVFAVAGTVFSIVGPKILGKATTELFNGLVAKVNGTGEINFEKIGMILLWTHWSLPGKFPVFSDSGLCYDRNFQ